MSEPKQPARQFLQLFLDELKDNHVSIPAKVVVAYVRYRLYKRDGIELSVADVAAALGVGERAARTAIREALDVGLITRSRSKRPGGAYVYRLPDEGTTAAAQDVRCGGTTPASAAGVVQPVQQGGTAAAQEGSSRSSRSQTPDRASRAEEPGQSQQAQPLACPPAAGDPGGDLGGSAPEPPPWDGHPADDHHRADDDLEDEAEVIDLFDDHVDARPAREEHNGSLPELKQEPLAAGATRKGQQVLIDGYGAVSLSTWKRAAAEVGAEVLVLALRERAQEGQVKRPDGMVAHVVNDIREGTRPKRRPAEATATSSIDGTHDERWAAVMRHVAGEGGDDV